MDIRLIAFDLDDTVLNSHKELTPRTEKALYAAHEAGIELVPATGRTFAMIPSALQAMPFIRYGITINGALVYDRREDRALSRADIPNAAALEVLDYLSGTDYLYDCFYADKCIINREMYDRYEEYLTNKSLIAFLRSVRRPVENVAQTVRDVGPDVHKFLVFFRDEKERPEAMAQIIAHFPNLSVTSSNPRNMELNFSTATKGGGLTALCRALDIDVSRTVAFGDGMNDLSMISAAGFGVAMANADSQVLAAADYIAPDNNSDGVADTVEKLLSGEI